jgi:hypothetical protein
MEAAASRWQELVCRYVGRAWIQLLNERELVLV